MAEIRKRLRFMEFTLEMEEYRLTRSGEPIHLTPKAMELLILLARNRPRLMTRKELIDRLWPDVVVVPTNLRNLVSEVRCALSDRAGEIVRTVHGRGYAFTDRAREVMPAREVAGSPVMSLQNESQRLSIPRGENTIGRGSDCDVVIPDSRISRHHARITTGFDEVTVLDLNSRNGTFVSGQRITALTPISDGDEISFGPLLFKVSISNEESETRSASSTSGRPPRPADGS